MYIGAQNLLYYKISDYILKALQQYKGVFPNKSKSFYLGMYAKSSTYNAPPKILDSNGHDFNIANDQGLLA